MVCVKEDQAKEGTYAFTEEFYHIELRGSPMGMPVAPASTTFRRSRSLVFVAVALMLRNLWVWIHAMILAEGGGEAMTVRLELLRFKRLLDWIAQFVLSELHDGSLPCVEFE